MEDEEKARIELIVHDGRTEPVPFGEPGGFYALTFPSGPDTLASRAITAFTAAAQANPDAVNALPTSRGTTAVTTDGTGFVAVWSDESIALLGQTIEALQALKDAIFPGQPDTRKLEELPPEEAALWPDILRMAMAAKLKAADRTWGPP